MHGKYQKLVEAAMEVISDHCGTSTAHNVMGNLADALQDLAELEPYKWLAYDGDSAWVYKEKPEWDSDWVMSEVDKKDANWETTEVVTPPSFLKPGQLWERQQMVIGNFGYFPGQSKWNGYWWKPVEDHSKRCDNCAHYQERDGATCCWHCMRFDPIYNMNGCEWSQK